MAGHAPNAGVGQALSDLMTSRTSAQPPRSRISTNLAIQQAFFEEANAQRNYLHLSYVR